MVVWQGITEGGTAVPIQVTEEGRVVAEGQEGPAGPPGPEGPQGPQGEYGPGDDVVLGSGSFTNNSRSPDDAPLTVNNTNTDGYLINGESNGANSFSVTADGTVFVGNNDSPKVALLSNGQVKTNGTVTIGSNSSAIGDGDWGLQVFGKNNTSGYALYMQGEYTSNTAPFFARCFVNGTDTIDMRTDGSVKAASNKCGFTKDGELYFTSRNARYKLVVSDQLVLAEPYTRQMELREKAEAARAPRPADNVEND